MDGSTRPNTRKEAAASSIRTLRTRLLDLTARNPLVSFSHARQTGSRTNVRAVNGYLNTIFEEIDEGRIVTVRSLPSPDDEPEDERTDRFVAELEVARVVDEDYGAALGALTDEELASPKAARVERKLRDRVRETLGMPLWRASTPKGLADYATSLGVNPSFDLPPTSTERSRGGRGARIDLQTLMLPDPMERALAKIRETARTVAEETGVSTLHLAFGFLEWFESDSSDRPITSPLLLMRVDIDRKIVRSHYQYFLNGIGDEAQANLTLSERLNRDFRIKISDFGEDEDPEAYLDRVQAEVCKGRPRWTVRRWVTLAHFPFARLAMFNDLSEDLWTSVGGLADHPLIGEMLGGSESGQSSFAEEHDVDAPEVAAKVPLLVLEADASQHSAIFDVMAGKNLVIEGPPGTGKSQSITNVIAAALANGKRVLFIADKQAALQVVKDRLDKVGLGDFCLELHSGKARKKEVVDALRQRIMRKPTTMSMSELDQKLRELSRTRTALTQYVNILNNRVGAFGATVHDILWADRRRRHGEGEEARRLDALPLPGCEDLTRIDIERRTAVLDRLERAAQPILSSFGSPSEHPWYGVMRNDLPSVDIEPAVRDASDVAIAMGAVDAAASGLRILGLDVGSSIQEIQALSSVLSELLVAADVPTEIYRGLSDASTRRDVREWLIACETYKAALAELHDHNIAWPIPNRAEVADALTTLSKALPPIKSGLTVSDLASWKAELGAEVERLVGLSHAASQASALFGLDNPGSFKDVAVVLTAIDLASDAGDRVVAFITSELAARDSKDVIGRAANEIATLEGQRLALTADYNIPASARPDDFRRHASSLREAGLFAFLSSTAKASRRTYVELRRTPAKVDKKEMAATLIAIAEHLEGVAALEARHEYRAAFGNRYCGLATDTEAASAVAEWANRVRAELAGIDTFTVGARQILLSGDQDRLQAIIAFSSNSELVGLGECVLGVSDYSTSIETLTGDLETKAAAVGALAEVCDRYGVAGITKVADLPNLCRLLRTTHAAAEAARLPDPLVAALPTNAQPPLGDHASLRAALTLAESIGALQVSDQVRRVLHSMEPTDLSSAVVPAAQAAKRAVEQALLEWLRFRRLLVLDETEFFGGPLRAGTPTATAERLQIAAAYPSELGEWIGYLIERKDAESLGLGGLLGLWDEQGVVGPLSQAFDRILHRALARFAFGQHPELDRFTGLSQDETRARFKSLDAEATELRRGMLACDLSRRPVPRGNGIGRRSEYTDSALIWLEVCKQKRLIPLRQLFDRAGDAVQALKPCFMMSPLSVAQYLKPTGPRFDLLVIDEASQMRPEDALGAIARSDQIVVVGDPKQLPPTSFFARADSGNDDDENEEEQVDSESILDLAQTVFRPMRRLRWHYRSRHGSLIAFSNREFYDDDLLVFPSPTEADPSQGVAMVKVDGIYKSRSNLIEVDAVCRAAVEHMRTNPERSLGIATMNQVQRDLIQQRMDHLAAEHREVEEYRERWRESLERFFVKNLETVQGDERDVIFISTVFGPSQLGGQVKQTFGPINGATGHRRLNVLFTRAKHHVRLFTSMTPDDVQANSDSPRGAQVLKRYLAYAADGRLDAGKETGREADSDFEVFVCERLRTAGYDAVPQVGVAGFFIDLAVRHPDTPGTFLLGIECDGASYHSSKSARDRDILRQKVLEGLGWIIYRIWSTDWFRDPAGQTRKLTSFIEEMRARPKTNSPTCSSAERGPDTETPASSP
jgi:very-short-patch-repair endonuclease